MKKEKLKPRKVTSESVLGPILFLVYVNDISGRIHRSMSLFEDYAKMLTGIVK